MIFLKKISVLFLNITLSMFCFIGSANSSPIDNILNKVKNDQISQ